ncbi:MAG TPA: YcnI family protein [Acidimicrobiales bacterium]
MRTRRLIGVAALAAGAIVTLASPAFAHVTVDPSSAPKGGDTTLTFRVPNEMDNANTVKIDVKLPDDHPFSSVVVQPKAGWTYQVTNTNLATPITTDEGAQITQAASEVAWTGGQIKPGEFDEFTIFVEGLPDDVDSLSFPTVQSYDNGQDVSWIEQSVAGQPEPDHPAPVLQLTAATPGGSDSSAPSSSGQAGVSVTGTVVKKETNNGLAIAALVVGAVGLIIGIVALVRGRGDRAVQT